MFLETRDGLVLASAQKDFLFISTWKIPEEHLLHVASWWIRTLNGCSSEAYRQLKRSENSSHQPQALRFCRWGKSGDADGSGLNICSSWSHVQWVFTSGCKWFNSHLFSFWASWDKSLSIRGSEHPEANVLAFKYPPLNKVTSAVGWPRPCSGDAVPPLPLWLVAPWVICVVTVTDLDFRNKTEDVCVWPLGFNRPQTRWSEFWVSPGCDRWREISICEQLRYQETQSCWPRVCGEEH